MRAKVLVLGVILLAVGVLLFVFPGLMSQFGSDLGLLPPAQHPAPYLVRVAPGNFSYLNYAVGPNDEVNVKIATGQQAVDFFLMNQGNFSSWVQGGGGVGQVFPQSALDVKNYSFALTGTGRSENYSLVFVSRSTSSPTDVLVQLVRSDTSLGATFTVTPLALIGFGAVLLVLGRGGGGRRQAEPERVETPQATPGLGGWQELLGLATPKCKYCGADLGDATGFCPSCKRSLG